MSTMVGADADALDNLSRQLEQSGQLIRRSAGQLSRSLGAAPWHGRSADRFRQCWSQDFRGSMVAAACFLDEAGEELRRHAREQRAASATHGGPFGRGFCTLPGSHGRGKVEKSWIERWLDGEFTDELLLALKAVKSIATFSLFGAQQFLIDRGILSAVKGVKNMGSLVPGLSILLGGIGMGLAIDDLLNDHPYSGNFGHLESASDVLAMGSGALGVIGGVLLIPPASPIGATVLAVSAGLGIASMGIDYGLKAWDEWGGRELWNNSIAPALHDTWNSARDVGSSVVRTVSDVASTATKPFRDAADGLSSLGKKVLSWP